MSDSMAIEVASINKAMSEGAGAVICSIDNSTREGAKRVYNAMNNPKYKVADYINKTIEITDVFIEIVDMLSEETGEIATVPRTVLIDAKGEGYQATSKGIFDSVRKAYNAFGAAPWEPALKIEIKQKPVARGSMLLFDVVD